MISAAVNWLFTNAEAIASLGLTAALVRLYSQQKKLVRVEKLPEIEISSRTIDGDDLEVEISNYGPGLAKNVEYQAVIHAPDADDFEPLLVESRARRLSEGLETTLERSIQPHESRVKFRGTPRFGWRSDGEPHRYANFSTAVRHLDRQDIESIWFQIYVVVEDRLEGCQMKPLFWPARNPGDIAKEVDIEERIDLEKGYDLGGIIEQGERPDILTPDCRD